MQKPRQKQLVEMHNLLHDRTKMASREASISATKKKRMVSRISRRSRQTQVWDTCRFLGRADAPAGKGLQRDKRGAFLLSLVGKQEKPKRTLSNYVHYTLLGPDAWPMINTKTMH